MRRRNLFGMFAGGLLALGPAAMMVPAASAQPAPAPNCSVSSVAGTVSTAAAAEGAHLVANPCGLEIVPTPVARAVWDDTQPGQSPVAVEAPRN